MSTLHTLATLFLALPRLVSLCYARLASTEFDRSVVLELFVPSLVWRVTVSAAPLVVLHAMRHAQSGAVDEQRKASLNGCCSW